MKRLIKSLIEYIIYFPLERLAAMAVGAALYTLYNPLLQVMHDVDTMHELNMDDINQDGMVGILPLLFRTALMTFLIIPIKFLVTLLIAPFDGIYKGSLGFSKMLTLLANNMNWESQYKERYSKNSAPKNLASFNVGPRALFIIALIAGLGIAIAAAVLVSHGTAIPFLSTFLSEFAGGFFAAFTTNPALAFFGFGVMGTTVTLIAESGIILSATYLRDTGHALKSITAFLGKMAGYDQPLLGALVTLLLSVVALPFALIPVVNKGVTYFYQSIHLRASPAAKEEYDRAPLSKRANLVDTFPKKPEGEKFYKMFGKCGGGSSSKGNDEIDQYFDDDQVELSSDASY